MTPACAAAGSLFGTRLGFTGTPNDLTPDGVSVGYDAPAEAAIFRALSSPATLSVAVLAGWSIMRVLGIVAGVAEADLPPPSTLMGVAAAPAPAATPMPPLRALIDVGALVTGLTNKEVAAALLALGLDVDGVIYFGALIASVRLRRRGLRHSRHRPVVPFRRRRG